MPSPAAVPHRLPVYGVPGRMTRRLAAIVVGTQGLAVFFGALAAHGLAPTAGSASAPGQGPTGVGPGTALGVGLALAGVCLLDAGLLRRPWGVTLGWLLQVATLAAALVVPLMLAVGLVFLAFWLYALWQGPKLDDLAEAAVAEREAAARHTGS